MLRGKCRERRQRLIPLAFGLVGVDGGSVHQLAGGIHHGHLAAGADTRVNAHHRLGAGRRGQQQVLEINGEDLDGLFLGGFPQAGHQFGFQPGENLHPPGVPDHLGQPTVRRAALVADVERGGHHAFAGTGLAGIGVRLADFQGQAQHPFLAASHQRQGAVGRDGLDSFPVIEIVGELGAALFLFRRHLRANHGVFPAVVAKPSHQVRIFREFLGQDGLGAILGSGRVLHALVGRHERGSRLLRIGVRLRQQFAGEGLQAGLPGDLALGAPLLLVRQIQVFQALLGVRLQNGLLQLGREFALFLDLLEDRGAALVHLPEVDQPLFQFPQLGVVQSAGHLFPVTGDEGHGGAFVQQRDGGLHLLRADGEFGGERVDDFVGHIPVGSAMA